MEYSANTEFFAGEHVFNANAHVLEVLEAKASLYINMPFCTVTRIAGA